MSNNIAKASAFILKSMILSNDQGKSVDIKLLTNSFTINENMSDGFISGKIHVFDGLALYIEFPLRGQEYIEVDIMDFDRNIYKAKFAVFAIDNLKPVGDNNDHMMQYTIHFASMHKVYNESAYIRKAFRNSTITQYATEVFEGAFLGDAQESKEIEIDQTDNMLNVVSPGYNPINTMHFFARKAYSNIHQSGTFRFYERRDKFQFRNHETIAEDYRLGNKTAKIFGINMVPDSSPQGQLDLRKTIVSFDLGTHVNTIRDLNKGLYNRTILELDHDNRQVIATNYKHLDNVSGYQQGQPMQDVHDASFNDIAYHPSLVIVSKNWATPYDPYTQHNMGVTMTTDILAKKQVCFELFHQNSIKAKIHGDLSIHAGDMLEIAIPKYKARTDSREIENPYNGLYLIDSIQHVFLNDEYYQELTLGRMGLKNF